MKKITLAALIAAPVVIAGGLTAFSASDNSATEAATYAATHPVVAPTITVTAPAKPAPTVTTTTTVTIPTVPQSCLDALDAADQGFGYASQAFTAVSKLDVDTMDQIVELMKPVAQTYNANKAACRRSAGEQ